MATTVILVVISSIVLLLLGLWVFGERGRLLRKSTRDWFSSSGIARFFNLKSIHGYIYMRWQTQYLGMLIKTMSPYWPKFFTNWLPDHYHGKVLTQDHAEKIIKINKNIPLVDLEQVIPYPHVRNFLFNAPPEILVYECGCRNSREVHCEPTQVCMWIGKPYTDFILEHNPKTSRRITREEALQLLKEEHERGHIHTAWFKDAMQDRFYCICNCCSCCCAGIEAMVKYGVPMMTSSGYVAQIDQSLCKNCGNCIEICPFNAVSRQNGNIVIDTEKCMGCGVCVDACPNQSRVLVKDEHKGIPMDLVNLVSN